MVAQVPRTDLWVDVDVMSHSLIGHPSEYAIGVNTVVFLRFRVLLADSVQVGKVRVSHQEI
jgi:hypothetical protein